jgi:hypothetical protein
MLLSVPPFRRTDTAAKHTTFVSPILLSELHGRKTLKIGDWAKKKRTELPTPVSSFNRLTQVIQSQTCAQQQSFIQQSVGISDKLRNIVQMFNNRWTGCHDVTNRYPLVREIKIKMQRFTG